VKTIRVLAPALLLMLIGCSQPNARVKTRFNHEAEVSGELPFNPLQWGASHPRSTITTTPWPRFWAMIKPSPMHARTPRMSILWDLCRRPAEENQNDCQNCHNRMRPTNFSLMK
jgi:hypothetical protein